MSDVNGGCREFAAYARLIDGNAAAWITALRYFGECPFLSLSVVRPRQVMGSLSALSVGESQIGHLIAHQAFRLAGVKSNRFSLLMVRSGELDIEAGERLTARPGDLVALGPGLAMTITAAGRADAILIQRPAIPASLPTSGHYRTNWAAPLLEAYLSQSRYFRDHCHATGVTEQFLHRLCQGLRQPDRDMTPPPAPQDDDRVMRAIGFIRNHPRWSFDLPTLARVAAASERNLYYLMKAQTGMTPYRFYQRCRLLQLREALLRCHCHQPSIAWHAMDQGFSHLGRFAALYRAHFGELPKDTLAWRACLRDQAGRLENGAVTRLAPA